ncbi:hypothetical protein TNCV_601011 [Trichonephila clavipes]|nr:hypothetical protein TNCV_601011 [Trichonephila clavipes]
MAITVTCLEPIELFSAGIFQTKTSMNTTRTSKRNYGSLCQRVKGDVEESAARNEKSLSRCVLLLKDTILSMTDTRSVFPESVVLFKAIKLMML